MRALQPSRTAWLSLTPEPERVLPLLLSGLRRISPAMDGAVRAEADRLGRLVVRGTGRRWLSYLDEVAAVAVEVADGRRRGDPEAALAVADIVLDHDRMLIGLPGRAYERTAQRRRALTLAAARLRARAEQAR